MHLFLAHPGEELRSVGADNVPGRRLFPQRCTCTAQSLKSMRMKNDLRVCVFVLFRRTVWNLKWKRHLLHSASPSGTDHILFPSVKLHSNKPGGRLLAEVRREFRPPKYLGWVASVACLRCSSACKSQWKPLHILLGRALLLRSSGRFGALNGCYCCLFSVTFLK